MLLFKCNCTGFWSEKKMLSIIKVCRDIYFIPNYELICLLNRFQNTSQDLLEAVQVCSWIFIYQNGLGCFS